MGGAAVGPGAAGRCGAQLGSARPPPVSGLGPPPPRPSAARQGRCCRFHGSGARFGSGYLVKPTLLIKGEGFVEPRCFGGCSCSVTPQKWEPRVGEERVMSSHCKPGQHSWQCPVFARTSKGEKPIKWLQSVCLNNSSVTEPSVMLLVCVCV